jgi:hypothetical protein
MTFPVAFRFFANWFTFWFRGLAMSNAMWLFAYSYAFRTVEHFTSFIRAFNFTFRFFAFDIANSVFGFSTRSVTFGRFTNRVANSGTVWIIALP